MSSFLFIGFPISKKSFNKKYKFFKNGQIFNFYNDYFEAKNDNENISSLNSIKYDSLEYILETKDMFYLYTGKNTAYLVNKRGFKTGTPEELRIILKKYIPLKKYKEIK